MCQLRQTKLWLGVTAVVSLLGCALHSPIHHQDVVLQTENGTPLPNVKLRIRPRGKPSQTLRSGKDGRAEVGDALSGTHLCIAYVYQYSPISTRISISTLTTQGEFNPDLTIIPIPTTGQTVNIDVGCAERVLPARCSLFARVNDGQWSRLSCGALPVSVTGLPQDGQLEVVVFIKGRMGKFVGQEKYSLDDLGEEIVGVVAELEVVSNQIRIVDAQGRAVIRDNAA